MMEARPMPRIGDINGATSMAPMITATEFVNNPSVAMLVESTTSRKKSNPGDAMGVISAMICVRLSAESGLISLRNLRIRRLNHKGKVAIFTL
jgi:hypothetical protein